MKKKILLFSLVACLCLAMLFGCGGGQDAENTTTSGEVTTTEPVVQEPTTVEIVKDGSTVYQVIRDEDASSSSIQVTVARSIVDKIKALTGTTIKISTDWVKRGSEPDSSTYEILVGMTDYKESKEVYSSIGFGDWAVRVVGNKIVVAGYTDSALSIAATKLNRVLDACVSSDGKSLIANIADITLEGTEDAVLNNIPVPENGQFSAFYNAGDDCTELIFTDMTADTYKAYLTKLAANGYSEYTTHQMAGNLFATYNSDEYTITAGYYDYENSIRVLFEPKAEPVGLESENKYTVVTTPQITMLGLEYKASDGSYASNGLCVLIRLSDGRFVVVDGGFNRANTATNLLNAMREQSKEYASKMSDITVAAWIITHSHGDHNGLLNGKYDSFRGITVERILVNYMANSERLKAINSSEYGGNWSSNEGGGYANTYTAAKVLGASLRKVHVGQVYYFADMKLEVLYTLESYAPKTCNAMNTTSLIMKMTIGDTVYMSTGDATGPAFDICNKMYGDYMQCDIVQVAHHGYTTWGNDTATAKAYGYMNAATVLWPQGLTAYPNYKDKSYNAALFKVSNYKEVYVAGSEGDSVIVPLPLVTGNAIVTRK